jgi:hypothetical protein
MGIRRGTGNDNIRQAGVIRRDQVGLLDGERIIAKAGFNRWLVPPPALCIHLCIGMAYGFSVFWLSRRCAQVSLV